MDDGISAILRRAAAVAARKAYAPYSAFRVGAALRTAGGATYIGCNVENASFPVGGCAERHAIAAAVAAEGPEMRIATIAIVALDPLGDEAVCAPCGACRQAILEFGGLELDGLELDGLELDGLELDGGATVIFRAAPGGESPGGEDDGIVSVTATALIPGAFSLRPDSS